jgi:hypothetical protein
VIATLPVSKGVNALGASAGFPYFFDVH